VLRQSRLVTELSAAAWKTLVDDFADHANANSNLTVTAWGGAINSYPREKSAFIHRDASFNIYVTGFWNGAAEEAQMQAYLERWREFIEPFWTGGIFQDFADTDCPDYRSSYWGEAFAALVAVKRKYDPSGLFSFSQAIQARPGKPEPVTWPPGVVAALSRPIEAPPSPNEPVAP
jgi:FAD/FMN-containing dehydrogenase